MSILGRNEAAMAKENDKVQFIQYKDFEKYPPELLEQLKGADACIWAQGISQTQVGKE